MRRLSPCPIAIALALLFASPLLADEPTDYCWLVPELCTGEDACPYPSTKRMPHVTYKEDVIAGLGLVHQAHIDCAVDMWPYLRDNLIACANAFYSCITTTSGCEPPAGVCQCCVPVDCHCYTVWELCATAAYEDYLMRVNSCIVLNRGPSLSATIDSVNKLFFN